MGNFPGFQCLLLFMLYRIWLALFFSVVKELRVNRKEKRF